ncbi:MFS transporter [Microbacterium soli]|uniref:MFS transporter n=1 Tax=Microbacterium soli TaxID=446075 RepID=A0ABP7MY47_9MICO
MTSTDTAPRRTQKTNELPWFGLLALFAAGFLSIINETTPAGLLPQIAAGLGVSEAEAGQTVTIYALATALTAVPLSTLLERCGRRTVLVGALAAFVVANFAIAATTNFVVILAARAVAGVGAGLIWTNLAAYAARIAPPALQGRAMAIANAGTPVALSIGLPLGTLLGDATGWQFTFAATGIAGIVVIGWVFLALPNIPGVVAQDPTRLGSILRVRGVVTILLVMCGFFLAHNVLYTYIAPLAGRAGIGRQIQWLLLVFGLAAMVSIWITGAWIDRQHRLLTVSGMWLVGIGAVLLCLALVHPTLLYLAAIMVTLVNLMIGAGGLVGGLLIDGLGVLSLPWAALVIMIPTALTASLARRRAFPRWTS